MEKSIEFIKRNYSPLILAYLGDSYFEILAREYVVGEGDCVVSKVNEVVKKYITAISQSRMIEVMFPMLDETETWFFKSGRNAKNTHHSKSADAVAYRRATGLECLYGYFYLSGQSARARELFLAAAKMQENGGEHL